MRSDTSGTALRARGRHRGDREVRRCAGNSPACAGTTRHPSPHPPTSTEQPRVRGDDRWLEMVTDGEVGTAPRARGRRCQCQAGSRSVGNSPACAGTTAQRHGVAYPAEEQPRVRGDDRVINIHPARETGTAPRARGRLPAGLTLTRLQRNSPACAGTTDTGGSPDAGSGEQPRVRGDDQSPQGRRQCGQGTAPRARGRQPVPRGDQPDRGNSPACAGTTWPCAGTSWRAPNSPACAGTTHAATVDRLAGEGTAPRARGRPSTAGTAASVYRNSPACAGTTGRSPGTRSGSREQPRVRGDDDRSHIASLVRAGTAPRARGRRPRLQRGDHPGGNSPACAGTTAQSRPCGLAGREQPRVRGDDGGYCYSLAHSIRNSPACAGTTLTGAFQPLDTEEQPRVRGDDTALRSMAHRPPGTAPRARGRHVPGRPNNFKPGNSPACAGTTAGHRAESGKAGEQPRVRGDDGRTPG